jgi:uncharacterized membrane protein
METSKNDRTLAAASYLLGVPALWVVLTERKEKGFIYLHGEQAFYLWLRFFIAFFALRLLITLLWRIVYVPYLDLFETLLVVLMAGYAAYCGYRSFLGKMFDFPH